ncbi:hypothetical protein J6590_056868 [Homalodisca vitripennis]|nr:hypothetical protein J6590_056868 [Homalodisca vitripennis]
MRTGVGRRPAGSGSEVAAWQQKAGVREGDLPEAASEATGELLAEVSCFTFIRLLTNSSSGWPAGRSWRCGTVEVMTWAEPSWEVLRHSRILKMLRSSLTTMSLVPSFKTLQFFGFGETLKLMSGSWALGL